MRWINESSGGNVSDRRGRGGGGMIIGGGLGTLIIAAIVFFLGGDPSAILGSSISGQPQTESRELTPEEKQVYRFVDMIAGANQNTWNEIFAENNMRFTPAKIVMFENGTSSGCGVAQSAMGPFYCPNDQTIYVDMSFFNELQSKFGARVSEFTVAYVLGHEYGHHVQNLLGTLDQTERLRRSGRYSERELNRVSVATELQADFFAGLWARKTNDRTNFMEPGDIEAAISAAEAVGDDNIQRRAQGYVRQESFTHGSSAQRKDWFMRGYNTGDIRQGNTFDQLLR